MRFSGLVAQLRFACLPQAARVAEQRRAGGFYFGEDRWDIGDIGDLWDTDEA